MEEESKIKLAKNIKLNFKLLMISLLIGIVSYPIIGFLNGGFKAISLQKDFETICKTENQKCEKVLREISSLGSKYETEEYYTSKLPITKMDKILGGGEADGKKLWKRYESMYYASSEIKQLDRFDDFVSLKMVSYNKTLINTKNRSFGKPAIFDALTIFFVLSFITIIGRYILIAIRKATNWTNKYSSKEI